MLGIGGGGDVVGALAIARAIERTAAGSSSAASPGSGSRSTLTTPARGRSTSLDGIERIGGGGGARPAATDDPRGRPRSPRPGRRSPPRPVALVDVNGGRLDRRRDRDPRRPARLRPRRPPRRRRRRPRDRVASRPGEPALRRAAPRRRPPSPERTSPSSAALRRRLRRRADRRRGARPGCCPARARAWTATISPGAEAAPEVVAVAGASPPRRASSPPAARSARPGRTDPGRPADGRARSGRSARVPLRCPPGDRGGGTARDLVPARTRIETARARDGRDGVRTELDYERERLAGRSA